MTPPRRRADRVRGARSHEIAGGAPASEGLLRGHSEGDSLDRDPGAIAFRKTPQWIALGIAMTPGLRSRGNVLLDAAFAVASGVQQPCKEASVLDTILLLTTVAFFAVSLAYVAACDRL